MFSIPAKPWVPKPLKTSLSGMPYSGAFVWYSSASNLSRGSSMPAGSLVTALLAPTK